ncbi:hypothetical protein DFJ77DRAFT_451202 [Powellomyces hirtus]|nr:hypothetical protein DFJ77DRAFT_451202 [Powellomyces hirtus]
MKFGKYIQSQQVEWAGPQYLNYKGLKKIINSLQHSPDQHGTFSLHNAGGSSQGSAEEKQIREFQALKTAFFFKLERELEKVNTFYLQKEADLKVRLLSLLDKRRISQSRQNRATHASLITLREGFLQFRHDLTKLQNYVEVNATGFRKILKKWDKRSKSSTKELYLSRQIEIQPCFNNDVLAELTDQGTTNLAEIEHLLSEEDPEATTDLGSRGGPGQSTTTINETPLINALKQKNASGVRDFLASLPKWPGGDWSEDEKEFLCKSFLRFCTDTSVECLDILLEVGAVDCNYVDDISGRTCLHELAIAGRQEMIERCIKRGAKLEATDVYGRTPLHYASMHGKPASAVLLIKFGAKVNAIDHDGCTPLVYSITGGQTECVGILIDNGAVIESHSATAPIPLCLACEHGHRDIAMMLLSKGAQLTANAEGLFPLHLTSREGRHDISKLLIAHGADVNAPDGFNGWAPIFYAASEGHLTCVQVLLDAGCESNLVDEFDWSPCTYALYRGHIQIARLLESKNCKKVVAPAQDMILARDSGIKPMAPSGLFSEESGPADTAAEMDLDELPDLSLPPPIIPFRIYGHAFLDKRFYIHVSFRSSQGGTAHSTRPVTLLGSQQTSSLKMVISSKPEVGVPYSVILPLQDDLEVYSFLVEDLETFSLQFNVFPTFGTKPIGLGAIVPSQISMIMRRSWNGAGESEQCICPLFDSHLRVVGEVQFGFGIVKPFAHPSMQIGGKVETYWKSTQVVGSNKSDGVHSFVTASSLAEEYIQVVVQLTSDGIPVIYPEWYLTFHGLDLSLGNVTFAQAREIFSNRLGGMQSASTPTSATPSGLAPGASWQSLNSPSSTVTSELAKIVSGSFLSLQEILLSLPSSVGVSIVIKYPTSAEQAALKLTNLSDVNTVVDTVLQTVYDQASDRSIIFMSFNPSICTAINWKQPNYGVFFGTRCGYEHEDNDGQSPPSPATRTQQPSIPSRAAIAETDPRCNSIKGAIRFAKSSNLLGVVCEAAPLVQAPILIKTIKESGLLLATCGNANNLPANVRVQDTHGVDAIIVNDVFRYNVT